MMPGLGFTETILLVIVAIVVIGPKDLPLMMRKFGRFTGRMRSLAFEFRQGFDELGRQAELDELKREVADLKQRSGLSDLERDMVNDAQGIQDDVSRTMHPPTIGPMAAGAVAASVAPPAIPDGAPAPEPIPAAPEVVPVIAPPPALEEGSAPAPPREDAVAR
jgi:sec-independent protein translocase protein TatB